MVLMFDQREMTYYVALFQDKHLWRVIKSQEKSRAERVYANFVQQTVQLADVEIRRTELQAQKTFLERVIALQANRAQHLQADLSVARSQRGRGRAAAAVGAGADAGAAGREAGRASAAARSAGAGAATPAASRHRVARAQVTTGRSIVSTHERNPAKPASPGFLLGAVSREACEAGRLDGGATDATRDRGKSMRGCRCDSCRGDRSVGSIRL
ncbi:hypothetical protein EMIT0158MI4_10488 [Burkholderia ambifaria]